MSEMKAAAEADSKDAGWINRITAWGAPITLAISLVSSVYAVYSVEFKAPREQAAAKHEQAIAHLAAVIDEINAINRDMQAKWLAADSSARQTISASAGIQKQGLIDEAEKTAATLKSDVTSYQYYVIASEKAGIGRFDEAYKYADLAVDRESDAVAKINLKLWLATMHLTQEGAGGMNDARKRFEEIKNNYSRLNGPMMHIQLAGLYANMAAAEAYNGDCDTSAKNLVSFANEISSVPSGQMGAASAARQTLYQWLNGQTRCSWDPALVTGS